MKKSLIALAVAGVFAAPVAMAETTIYGAANVSYDAVSGGTNATSNNQISSNASAIGLKGTEDLGGGLSAVWQLETAVNFDNNGAAGVGLGTNSSYAGLSGKDWGSLLLGQPASPYKNASRGLDLFADTIADNRALIGPFDGTNFGYLANAVMYTSPNMSGFTVSVATVAGAETITTSTPSKVKGSGYSLAGMYSAGPINAFLAYQTLTAGSGATGTLGAGVGGAYGSPFMAKDDKATAWTLGGSYAMDAFQVNLSYEKRTYDTAIGSASNDNSDWYLAGKYNVSSSDAVKLAYGRVNDMGGTGCGCNDTGASQISVGYDHNLSKNTTVYALYTQMSNKKNAGYGMGGYDGITANAYPLVADTNPHAFSLGMKHSF